MQVALKLAERGLGKTSPNPSVGAVLIRNNKIIGRGFHRAAGLPHAEIEAIKNCRENIRGATLFVTLEPCNHIGRTQPCTKSILQAGIKTVVFGSRDPNLEVEGRGGDFLKKNGIEVRRALEKECDDFLKPWKIFITKKRPFVILKMAISSDGKITASQGKRYILNELALKEVHHLRTQGDAILVGAGTVRSDNPELTTRLVQGKNPLRVILDSRLALSSKAKVFNCESSPNASGKNQKLEMMNQELSPDASEKNKDGEIQDSKLKNINALVVTTSLVSKTRQALFNKQGIEIFLAGKKEVDLKKLLLELGRRDIATLLVEGGAQVAENFLRQKLVDRLMIFISPAISGPQAKTLLSPLPICGAETKFKFFGEDLLLVQDLI